MSVWLHKIYSQAVGLVFLSFLDWTQPQSWSEYVDFDRISWIITNAQYDLQTQYISKSSAALPFSEMGLLGAPVITEKTEIRQ